MDADKIKEFFVYHVEKIILVVVVAAAGVMIYSGLQKTDIRNEQAPDALVREANQVKQEVDVDHTEAIMKDRVPEFNISAEIKKRTTAVDPSGYDNPQLYEAQTIASNVRRKDPRLAAPRAVIANGMLASIATRSVDGDYRILSYPPADEVERIVEKKKPKKRERRSRQSQMGDEYGMGGGMEEEMEMEMEMEDGYGGESDMMEMGGGAAVGAGRMLNRDHDIAGWRPVATKNLRTKADQPPVPGTGWFIAGTAVVPYKEIYESYSMALSTADQYDPLRRDTPIFRGFQLQRADVTEKTVDQLVEADWIKRDGNTETTYDAILHWSGFAPELVAKEYRVDRYLTMWIPPVLLEDYTQIALHPLIPMKTPAEILRDQQLEALKNLDQVVDETDLILNEDDSAGGMNQGYDGGGEYGMDMDMDMDMGMEGGMYGGGGGMGMGGPQAGLDPNPVEYKLIRFYDFAIGRGKDDDAPKPGRKYVYRVRYSVNDPNFPKDPVLQPKGRSLAPDVYARFIKKVAAAEKTKKRDYMRWSEWSEPSAPTSLPGREKFFVGPIKAPAPKMVKVGNLPVPFQAEPPSGKVVVSQFNPSLGIDMPVMMDITEGTVLSSKLKKVDIVDPITLEVKKYTAGGEDEDGDGFVDDGKEQEFTVATSATVIDIDGGAPMTIQEGDDMFAPGIMLMYDQNGGLSVHDEAGDQEFYRIKSFADERGEK